MATATKKRRTRTAKNGSINKAEEIRKAAAEIGGTKVRPKDVIAKLAEKGITVAPAQVSSTLKAAGFRRVRRGGRPAGGAGKAKAGHAGENGLTLEHLLAAKNLIAKIGNVAAAKKALDVLAKLS